MLKHWFSMRCKKRFFLISFEKMLNCYTTDYVA
jgi:hypothetical protein